MLIWIIIYCDLGSSFSTHFKLCNFTFFFFYCDNMRASESHICILVKLGSGRCWGYVLSQSPGSEQLGDEVESSSVDINPGGVEPNDGVVTECAEEMNLRVESLQIIRWSEHFIELYLVPCHFHSKYLINCLVHCFHCTFAKDFFELHIVKTRT